MSCPPTGMSSTLNTAAVRTPTPRPLRAVVRRCMTRTTTGCSTSAGNPQSSARAALGRGLDLAQRGVHAVDKFPLEVRGPAEKRVHRHTRYRLDPVLGVPALDHPGAVGDRLQFVAPDRVVHVDPKCQLLVRNHLEDGTCRRPEQQVAAVDVDGAGALADRTECPHQATLWAPLRHAREITDQRPDFETGALISTCACNSGAAIRRVPPSSGPLFSVGIALVVQSGLRATRAAAGSVALHQEDHGAQYPDSQPGQRQRSPRLEAGYDERGHGGNQPGHCADAEHRPYLQQGSGQHRRIEAFARLDRHGLQHSPTTMPAALRPEEKSGNWPGPTTMPAALRPEEKSGNWPGPSP